VQLTLPRIAAAVLAASVASNASAASLLSYGWGLSDATVTVGSHTFRIYVHPRDDTLLIQAAMKDMGANPSKWLLREWRTAAETLVTPVGCGISEVRAMARMGASWEATYVCPPGVDLRALIKAQRHDLQQGAQLHR
jgi:hypothetical protein